MPCAAASTPKMKPSTSASFDSVFISISQACWCSSPSSPDCGRAPEILDHGGPEPRRDFGIRRPEERRGMIGRDDGGAVAPRELAFPGIADRNGATEHRAKRS